VAQTIPQQSAGGAKMEGGEEEGSGDSKQDLGSIGILAEPIRLQ